MMINTSFYLLGYHTENRLAIMFFQHMDKYFCNIYYILWFVCKDMCDYYG